MAIRRVGLRDTILKDRRIRKFRIKMGRLIEKDTLDTLIDEMKALHAKRWERRAAREGRRLIEKSQSILIDMVMRNQSYRSRCAAIKMDIYVVFLEVESYISSIVKYVIAEHGGIVSDLTGGSRTKSDREGFVESLFEKELKFKMRLATVLKIADILIEDLDQAGWAVQRTTNVLQITQGKGAARI